MCYGMDYRYILFLLCIGITRAITGVITIPPTNALTHEQVVTLTLEVGAWSLIATHRLIMTNICAKPFEYPFIGVEDIELKQISNRPTDRQAETYVPP